MYFVFKKTGHNDSIRTLTNPIDGGLSILYVGITVLSQKTFCGMAA